jgi:hypothetical protein
MEAAKKGEVTMSPVMTTPRCCDACGEAPKEGKDLLGCSRCKRAWYHDGTCQRTHYKQHKNLCRQLAVSYSGVVVVDSQTALGRVALADRDFEKGENVLCEVPALVFDANTGYFGLWDAFLVCEAATVCLPTEE